MKAEVLHCCICYAIANYHNKIKYRVYRTDCLKRTKTIIICDKCKKDLKIKKTTVIDGELINTEFTF